MSEKDLKFHRQLMDASATSAKDRLIRQLLDWLYKEHSLHVIDWARDLLEDELR